MQCANIEHMTGPYKFIIYQIHHSIYVCITNYTAHAERQCLLKATIDFLTGCLGMCTRQ